MKSDAIKTVALGIMVCAVCWFLGTFVAPVPPPKAIEMPRGCPALIGDGITDNAPALICFLYECQTGYLPMLPHHRAGNVVYYYFPEGYIMPYAYQPQAGKGGS
jgi:hypothetical protein